MVDQRIQWSLIKVKWNILSMKNIKGKLHLWYLIPSNYKKFPMIIFIFHFHNKHMHDQSVFNHFLYQSNLLIHDFKQSTNQMEFYNHHRDSVFFCTKQ